MWLEFVFIYFLAAFLGHALLCRSCLPGNSVVKFLASGTAAGLGLIFHESRFIGANEKMLSTALMYAFICEVYIFLFTFVKTSISASLLFVLRSHALSEQQIERLYPKESMVSRRMEKLFEEGLLESKDDRSVLTTKGQRVVKIFRALQSFFGHRPDFRSPRSSKAYS